MFRRFLLFSNHTEKLVKIDNICQKNGQNLVKVGEDYGVFQNAQGTARMLKQIKKLMDKI